MASIFKIDTLIKTFQRLTAGKIMFGTKTQRIEGETQTG